MRATAPPPPEKSKIIVSTSKISEIFPVDACIEVKPIESNRFKFLLIRQGHETKELIREADFPDVLVPGTPVTVRDEFTEQGRRFLAVITVCPGREPDSKPRYLFGQIYGLGVGVEGATGVWVAEEQGR